MISVKTCEKIWICHREIISAEKLLADMERIEKEPGLDPHEKKLSDAFGRRRDLQLGVPSGENAHRLFNVSPHLAKSVIKAHKAKKEAELIDLNECARMELATEDD